MSTFLSKSQNYAYKMQLRMQGVKPNNLAVSFHRERETGIIITASHAYFSMAKHPSGHMNSLISHVDLSLVFWIQTPQKSSHAAALNLHCGDVIVKEIMIMSQRCMNVEI